ncbi:MAG TPA: hypothetical protein VG710_05010 [Opitutus sp.]|nr:hypothetical protein [Opitutus sp.]
MQATISSTVSPAAAGTADSARPAGARNPASGPFASATPRSGRPAKGKDPGGATAPSDIAQLEAIAGSLSLAAPQIFSTANPATPVPTAGDGAICTPPGESASATGILTAAGVSALSSATSTATGLRIQASSLPGSEKSGALVAPQPTTSGAPISSVARAVALTAAGRSSDSTAQVPGAASASSPAASSQPAKSSGELPAATPGLATLSRSPDTASASSAAGLPSAPGVTPPASETPPLKGHTSHGDRATVTSAKAFSIATENSSVMDDSDGGGSAGSGGFGSNNSLSYSAPDDKSVQSTVGIDVAQAFPDMESPESQPRSLSARQAMEAFHADLAAPGASAPIAQPLDSDATAAANQVFASVLRVIDRPEQAASSRVSLHFSFGSEPLAVHVELRGGEVHTVFECGSTDLHAALAREWPQFVAQLPEHTSAAGEPRFVPPAAVSGDSARQGSSGREQPAQFEPPTGPVVRGGASKTTGASPHATAPRRRSLQLLDALA